MGLAAYPDGGSQPEGVEALSTKGCNARRRPLLAHFGGSARLYAGGSAFGRRWSTPLALWGASVAAPVRDMGGGAPEHCITRLHVRRPTFGLPPGPGFGHPFAQHSHGANYSEGSCAEAYSKPSPKAITVGSLSSRL